MTLRRLLPAVLAASLLSGALAVAEEPGAPAEASLAAELPAACRAAAPKHETKAPGEAMQGSMGGKADPVQAGNMAAMEAMHGPMMQAAMIPDADLAFNCGMIAHHRGAIAMAKVELAHGKDAASRALAERIVAAQEEEIAEMTAWVEAHAK